MAISYSPNLYSGTLYQEIFQEIFFANKTVRDGYVRLIDNVKDATILTSLSSTTALKDYQAEPTTSTSLTPSDTSLAPVQVMLYEEFDPNVLRGSRFAVDMAAGSFNMMSNEFDRAVMEHFSGKFGQAIERAIWQNVKTADKTAVAASALNADVKRGIAQSDAVVSVNGLWAKATFTSAIAATNVKIATKSTDVATAFANLLTTCPTEAVMREDFTIFAPHAYYQAILAKNSAETYRDKFVVIPETKEVFYQGIPVKFVPLTYTTGGSPAACLIAGPANDLVVGADLFSDSGIVEIGKKFNYGDTMFVKAKFSLDTAVMFPANFTVQCNY